jgi:RNA polymerase sigma factor (sigma-70 family)
MEPWRAKLSAGDPVGAWDLFIARYRRLVLTTIRRTLGRDEDLADVFADVCATLSANDLERLRRYRSSGERGRFSTWLVAVVHNHTIDWLRRREGRPRPTPPPGLTAIQLRIFEDVLVHRFSHAEAYERARARDASPLSFGSFLKEVAAMYRAVERARARGVLHYLAAFAPEDRSPASAEVAFEAAELAGRLRDALDALAADERLAVQLYIVDGVSAAEVARVVGWPDAKSVYNRVHRALHRLRERLQRQGIPPAEL